jgi:hypothetical protein
MMSSDPNPRALRRCLPGSAYSTCAHIPSDVATLPICPTNCPSQSPLSRLPAQLRPPAHPLGHTDNPTILYPEPQSATVETEQNPLKIDCPPKV